MDFLRRWWPALPALIIAWFAASSFVEKYPRQARSGKVRLSTVHSQDSLMLRFRQELDAEKGSREGAVSSADNPFRPIRGHRPEGTPRPGRMTVPPPPRRYQLKGTVGTDVATIADGLGRKLIVKVGDVIDSAVVLSIEPNKVILKDRAGKFELLPER